MNLYANLFNAVQSGMSVSIVSLVACPDSKTGNEGQMLLFYSDGRVEGTLIDEMFTQYVIDSIAKLTWKQPIVIELAYKDEQGYKIFWDRPATKHKAVVFGAGHVSQYLVRVLAMLDYEITVVDDRPDFANKQRFPQAKQVFIESFQQALEKICPVVDVYTAIIIVTRGHQYDLQCLRALIHTTPGYLGMIGSRSRIRATLRLLRDEGVCEELLDNIHAPIGLDIGGQTPAEVAVSIAAEVVSVFNGRAGGSMSIVGGIRHGC